MYHVTDLSEPVDLIEFTPGCRLRMQFKLSGGEPMIDLRTWKKWRQDHEYHPKASGLMMESKYIRPMIAKIIEILDAHDKKNLLNNQSV